MIELNIIVLSSMLGVLLLLPWQVEAAEPNSQITVMGMAYCDTCSNNTFTRHSYFLPGVDVKIECMFKAISPRTAEQISFLANRTTNRYRIYKLEIPSVDGIECAREKAMGNSCRASLVSSRSSACNVPGSSTTSDEIAIKSMLAYTASAL